MPFCYINIKVNHKIAIRTRKTLYGLFDHFTEKLLQISFNSARFIKIKYIIWNLKIYKLGKQIFCTINVMTYKMNALNKK